MLRRGGLVGSSAGLIQNSSASADVYGGSAFAGGLVASMSHGGITRESSASGYVSVGDFPGTAAQLAANGYPEAGGLVGILYGYDVNLNIIPVTVINSYATGSVSGRRRAASPAVLSVSRPRPRSITLTPQAP